jgi:hypothetical protein
MTNSEFVSKYGFKVLVLMAVLAVALGSFIGQILYGSERAEKMELRDSYSSGVITNISINSPSVGGDVSRIETDKGIFYIKRTVSALKGANVSVKESDDGTSFLCFEDRDTCYELIGF